jgi:hypothetical protein
MTDFPHGLRLRVWAWVEKQILSVIFAAFALMSFVTPSGPGDGTMRSPTTEGQRSWAAVRNPDRPQDGPTWITTARHEQIQTDGQSSPNPNIAEFGGSADPAASSAPTPELEMDVVNQYLWSVYERSPTKHDGTGDFTWKDIAAAARIGTSLGDYVIRGMDRDLRELLYRAGLAMDSAGFRWTILSAFRDDYRQSLASGYKARVSHTLHGGSATTGGYGHGCAIDISEAEGDSHDLWSWLDTHSALLGLERPLGGIDPAHVQPRGAWHELAAALRSDRLAKGMLSEGFAADAPVADVSTALPSATDMLCIGLHHHPYDAIETKTTAPVRARSFSSAARAHHLGSTSIGGERPVSKVVGRLAASPAKPSRSLARHAPPAVPHRGGTT